MPLPDDERLIYAMITVHEIARADLSMSTPVYTLLTIGWSYIVNRYGTDELKQEVLPAVAAGKAFAGINTTEPGGGSDLGGDQDHGHLERGEAGLPPERREGLRQRPQGVHEVGPAERPLHAGQDRPRVGPQGHDLHLGPGAPRRRPAGPIYKDMGRMGLSTGGWIYKDVELPRKYVLGEEGKGFYDGHGRLQRRPRARGRGLPRRRREGARDQRRVHRAAHDLRQAARQVRGHLVRDGRRLDAARHAQAQPAARRLDDRPGAHQSRARSAAATSTRSSAPASAWRRRSATTSPVTA